MKKTLRALARRRSTAHGLDAVAPTHHANPTTCAAGAPTVGRALAAAAIGTALSIGLAAPAAAAVTGPNLAVNGDAEAALGGEWVNATGALARAQHGVGGYPGSSIIGGGSFDGGTYLFYGGSTATMETVQTIQLTGADLTDVAAGGVHSSLSAFIGGYAGQGDHLGLEATWKDALGSDLLTQVLDPVTNVERRNRSGFLPREDIQTIPAGATQVAVKLTGTRTSGTANDGYIDNISLRLIRGNPPQLSKAFGPTSTAPGVPSRLTLTIANPDPEAATGWTFTDDLAVGLAIASPANATTTCPNAVVEAPDGGETIGVTGDVDASSSCTVSVDVVGDAKGTYANGADNISAIGLLRPAEDAKLVIEDPAAPTARIADPGVSGPIGQGATVPVDFGCDGGIAPVRCEGTVTLPDGTVVPIADGGPLPTGQPGTHTITVTATDARGMVTKTTRTYVVAAPAPAPRSEDDILLECGRIPVTLIDVTRGSRSRRGGWSRTTIVGVADRRFAGQPVAIRYQATNRVVARPTVGADGRFRAQVADPDPRNRADAEKRRYRAEIGGERSLALKLTRRFTTTSVTPKGARWVVRATATRPLVKGRATVEVRIKNSCDGSGWKTIGSGRLAASGRVVKQIPAPRPGSFQVVRLVTTVDGVNGRKAGRTYTVPRGLR